MLISKEKEYKSIKDEIILKHGVISTKVFNPKDAIKNRVKYLKSLLRTTNKNAYVLAEKENLNTSVVGKLCEMAIDELSKEGFANNLILIRFDSKNIESIFHNENK